MPVQEEEHCVQRAQHVQGKELDVSKNLKGASVPGGGESHAVSVCLP